MEIEKCFLYENSEPMKISKNEKARLRKGKVSSRPLWPQRLKAFEDDWALIHSCIKRRLGYANEKLLKDVVDFVGGRSREIRERQGVIPTGLIVASSGILSHDYLFDQLAEKFSTNASTGAKDIFFTFAPSEAPNLKTALRNIVAKIGNSQNEAQFPRTDVNDNDASTQTSRLLEYDLYAVQNWLVGRNVRNAIMALQDSEGFDSSVLAEIVETLHIWLDRIPFTLIFGVATTSDMFEERLPSYVIRYLSGQRFDVSNTGELFESIFWATIEERSVYLRLGPSLLSGIISRQSDHIQSIEEFQNTIKYSLMLHYFDNPLSVFLDNKLVFKTIPKEYFAEIRSAPSFRRHVENVVANGADAGTELLSNVRFLLKDDAHLVRFVHQSVESGCMKIEGIKSATNLLAIIRQVIYPSELHAQKPAWYAQAMAGKLLDSVTMRETLLSVKRLSSDTFAALLGVVAESDRIWSSQYPRDNLAETDRIWTPLNPDAFRRKLRELTKGGKPDSQTLLKSGHDAQAQSVRTTVVAQKVELSRQKANLSKKDEAYSKLLDEFHSKLKSHFAQELIDPKDLVFHEVFMYDQKYPCLDVVAPRPRQVIERALSKPHDYLNCHCCVQNEATMSDNLMDAIIPSEPETSIIYRLYLESGALINVSDLWSAFQTMVEGNEGLSEEQQRAQFQQALSELKSFGMVRQSRKKTDHIAKLMWKGL